MNIGIYAEGWTDIAVIENILIGELGIDSSDITYKRPTDDLDETDLNDAKFSTWTLVKNDCTQGRVKEFVSDLEDNYAVIQIDTAECEEKNYEVKRPDKKPENYCSILRQNCINKFIEWIGEDLGDSIYYAIAIEEIDAWVSTLYVNVDTSEKLDAKKEFSRIIQAKINSDNKFKKEYLKFKNKGAFDKSEFLSKGFTKINKPKIRKCLKNNQSLKEFVESLEPLKVKLEDEE